MKAPENIRELLEFAARAADIELACWDEVGQQWIRVTDDPEKLRQNHGYGSAVFDPLEDDGDNHRLAVRLKIFMMPGEDECVAMFAPLSICVREPNMDDPHAAARLAVLRAAAEIGRAMP